MLSLTEILQAPPPMSMSIGLPMPPIPVAAAAVAVGMLLLIAAPLIPLVIMLEAVFICMFIVRPERFSLRNDYV